MRDLEGKCGRAEISNATNNIWTATSCKSLCHPHSPSFPPSESRSVGRLSPATSATPRSKALVSPLHYRQRALGLQ